MAEPAKKATDPKTGRLPEVPETLLKKRKIREEQKAKRIRITLERKKKALAKHKEVFKRAEKYVAEYRKSEREKIRLHRLAKKTKFPKFYLPAEPRVAFVVRIRGIRGLHPKPRKVLQLLRLRQINNGTFVRINKATLQMLRIADPNIAWGYPSLSTVRQLVYKRGYARVNGQRKRIQDNAIIEQKLGKFGIICMEDLVHELYTCGPHFKQASSFLWPFKLSNPNGGWRMKRRHWVDGGDFGNREFLVNRLLKTMV